MVKNKMKNLIFLVLFAFATIPTTEAGAGKSFGFFAGGALAGGLIGSAIAKRNRNNQPVVQERVVERPVYIQPQTQYQQTPHQQRAVVTHSYETQALRQEIMDLRRELRNERKAAEKSTKVQKKPKTTKQYSKEVFDEFDTPVEG